MSHAGLIGFGLLVILSRAGFTLTTHPPTQPATPPAPVAAPGTPQAPSLAPESVMAQILRALPTPQPPTPPSRSGLNYLASCA